ncbi:MAG: hypothetical protein HZB23_09240 [Deltaproteobacteria bacterium]|nr:hypothetical protein [Deltaproteobacteria bacterium]
MRISGFLKTCVAVAALFFAMALPANAKLGPMALPMEARVLYDNSGSMYPGYQPGAQEGRGQARMFHQYPQFQEFLNGLVRSQADNGASSVSFWAFTELIRTIVAAEAPIGSFDASSDLSAIPAVSGQRTFLTENLEAFTRDFEGLLWLVTDNIVDTRPGTADNRDVRGFFQSLNNNPAFKSVHVFKYPFIADGASSALSIYCILVCHKDFSEKEREEDLAPFDERIGKSLSVFPRGSSYLKLKDLSVGMVKLKTDAVKVNVTKIPDGFFGENRKVSVDLTGIIESRLTQHRIIQGVCSVAVVEDFVPVKTSARVKIRPIGSGNFSTQPSVMPLSEMEPRGTQPIKVNVSSVRPVKIGTVGFFGWLKSAFGLRACYSGKVEIRLDDVRVRLSDERLSGIWGIEHAGEVFDFDREQEITNINPGYTYVDFCLETGSGKGLFLIALLILFLIVGFFAARSVMGGKRAVFIIRKPDGDQMVSLGAIGSAPVDYRGRAIGRVSRNPKSGVVYKANSTVSSIRESDDSWLVTPNDATGEFLLRIERDWGEGEGGDDDATIIRPTGGPRPPKRRGGGPGPDSGGGPPSVPLPF